MGIIQFGCGPCHFAPPAPCFCPLFGYFFQHRSIHRYVSITFLQYQRVSHTHTHTHTHTLYSPSAEPHTELGVVGVAGLSPPPCRRTPPFAGTKATQVPLYPQNSLIPASQMSNDAARFLPSVLLPLCRETCVTSMSIICLVFHKYTQQNTGILTGVFLKAHCLLEDNKSTGAVAYNKK